MSEHDKKFFKNFSLLIAVLVLFCIGMIVLGNVIGSKVMPTDNPHHAQQVAERVASVGQVYAGEAGAEALAAASETTEEPTLAFDGSLDGEMIYNNVCMACHTTGAGGAPKLEASAWDERLAKGTDMLVDHAINGFQGAAGVMPAKGGRMDLSDEQVRASVEFMLAQIQ